jgi:hypothetical protein
MPLDFGSGNPVTNQTSTQQNIGVQSSGGRTRVTGGAQATQRGVATTGDRNRVVNASGTSGAVIQGTGNTANQIKTGKGGTTTVNTTTTTTGVQGDDLDSLIHDITSAGASSAQDFASFATNALNHLTPSNSTGVAAPSDINPVAPSQPSASTGFINGLADKLGLAPNDLMILLGALALFVSLYFVIKKK